MEAEIKTTTPLGSPILAYGQIRGPQFPRKIPGGFVALLVAALVVLTGILLLTLRVEIPQKTFVFAAFHGSEHLSDPLPRIWQNTATTSKLPFFAGVTKTPSGSIPFTITFRGFGNAGSWTHASGLFVIHADAPIETEKTKRVFSFVRAIATLGQHSAFVSINGNEIDPSLSGTLEGVIDGTIWKTSAKISQHSQTPLPNGDIAVDLVALPESWMFFRDALHAAGIKLEQIPQTLSWTESSNALPSIIATFGNETPSTSTILAFAAAAGQYDIETVPLEDGTVTQDLRLPVHLLLDAPTSTWSWTPSTGTLVRLDEHEARIENSTPPSPSPSFCPGWVIARLNAGALAHMTQLPLDENVTALEVSLENDRVVICWK